MQNQSLREILEQMDHEIQKTETLDEQGREMLTHLAADIQELLERSEETQESDSPLTERLAQAIEHFEISHPTLTKQLSQLSAVLSNAGI
jgi:hypothetical protein